MKKKISIMIITITVIMMICGTSYGKKTGTGDLDATDEKTGTSDLDSLGEPDKAKSSHTPDEVLGEAQQFINIGKNEGSKINQTGLQNASGTMANMLLTIGVFLTVAIGMYLGIKFMMSSAEGKAQVKEMLIPYIAGCVVIFGAFTIWKLAVTIFAELA